MELGNTLAIDNKFWGKTVKPVFLHTLQFRGAKLARTGNK